MKGAIDEASMFYVLLQIALLTAMLNAHFPYLTSLYMMTIAFNAISGTDNDKSDVKP